ncbi:GyrI-like domain-containing protein [bacterium]|nr:GyrI-like domain-containing protein [bacterium]MBU1025789.1 GyrI-like domain-containing protein [bacterium]
MEPKIVSKSGFNIIGMELKTSIKEGRNFKEIPQFWEKVLQQDILSKIPNKSQEATSLGMCMDFKEEDGSFSYVIACEVDSTNNIPEGMIARTIPGAKYAVFTCKGPLPDSIQNMVGYIHGEWFKKSEYTHAGTPEFELYDERCMGGTDCEVDIYIPVVKVN